MGAGERIAPSLVEEFVGVSHGNLDRVKELLIQEPALVGAAWDWGAGDWETGLGAAAHVGSKDIALYLMKQGAHIDLYAAAMLNKIEIVKAILSDNPDARHHPGPHGIPLLTHAEMGNAIEVITYLRSLE